MNITLWILKKVIMVHGFVSVPISTPRGTHFYRGKWNSLDRIMVPAWHLQGNCRLGRRKCLTPVWSSYAVIKKSPYD